MICRHCGTSEGVKLEDARTAYADDPYTLWVAIIHDDDPPDLNPPILLCRECALDHHDYWDDMWEEANYGRF